MAKKKKSSDKFTPRITKLEKKIGVPHEVQDFLARVQSKSESPATASTRALKAFDVLSSDVVAPAAVVDLIFNLTSETTAKLVRVYLPGQKEDIVNSSKPEGKLPNQIVGTFVTVVIQVAGNPDQIGAVAVRNAEPAGFKLKVSDGPVGTKPLFVTG